MSTIGISPRGRVNGIRPRKSGLNSNSSKRTFNSSTRQPKLSSFRIQTSDNSKITNRPLLRNNTLNQTGGYQKHSIDQLTTNSTINNDTSNYSQIQSQSTLLRNESLRLNRNPTNTKHIETQQNSLQLFDTMKLPIKPSIALQHFGRSLTQYEQGEILDFQDIFWLGLRANKIQNKGINYGFDDERSDYKIVTGDHIAYRYEILEVLGKGSFGLVVKAFDHKRHEFVAVKIIRNERRFHRQGRVEIKILRHIVENDREDKGNMVKMLNYFIFRKHLCICFQLLSYNLYELLKSNRFAGLSLNLIKRFAIQILNCLKFTHRQKIVHSDLKPENILLKQPNKAGIKVIDFGSACFETERLYTYIQSRFYRAPEIITGIPYTTKIDMWSLGCILGELFTGYPLFPGTNEQEQLLLIMEFKGIPPKYLLDRGSRVSMFFQQNGTLKSMIDSRGKSRVPDFINRCLEYDPEIRISPDEALQHDWLQMSSQIDNYHINMQTAMSIRRIHCEGKQSRIHTQLPQDRRRANQDYLKRVEHKSQIVQRALPSMFSQLPSRLSLKSQKRPRSISPLLSNRRKISQPQLNEELQRPQPSPMMHLIKTPLKKPISPVKREYKAMDKNYLLNRLLSLNKELFH